MIRKKIIIYLRKSRTDNQFESVAEVLERHEKMLQDYCMRAFGEPIPQENIYREVVSGETISERPVMMELLQEIETGNIDMVVVIEPQRLSRGSFGDIDKIVNTFKYTNTKIATPTKTYDLNNKFDRKYFEQELLRGNDYLEYVKEILVRGRKQSVEEGLYIGSVAPYGYDKKKLAKKGYTLVPNADAESVKYIFEQFVGGLGTTNLAKHLIEIGIKSQTGKQWTPAMTRNILMSKLYIGYVSYGRRGTKKTMKNAEIVKSRPINDDYIEVKGLHEPIITQEVFDKAQELLKSTPAKNIRGDKTIKNSLAGLIKCKYCGNNMFRRPYDRRDKPTLICKTIGCKCVCSDLDLVEQKVVELLHQELNNYKYFIANYEKENKNNAKTYEKQIKKIDKELTALQDDLQNALINYNRKKITEQEYIFLRNYTLKEENRLTGQKRAIEDKMKTEELESRKKAVPILENFINEYHTLSVEDKHKMFKSIIDKIIYDKTATDGRWNADARSSFTLELFLKI
jgi:hypothetical protein